jgi:hypothetical protein
MGRLWFWSAALRTAALMHRDPWHAGKLRELSVELQELDGAPSGARPPIPKAPARS